MNGKRSPERANSLPEWAITVLAVIIAVVGSVLWALLMRYIGAPGTLSGIGAVAIALIVAGWLFGGSGKRE